VLNQIKLNQKIDSFCKIESFFSESECSSQYGSESPALEVADGEWHNALIVVQTRNDDEDENVMYSSLCHAQLCTKFQENQLMTILES